MRFILIFFQFPSTKTIFFFPPQRIRVKKYSKLIWIDYLFSVILTLSFNTAIMYEFQRAQDNEYRYHKSTASHLRPGQFCVPTTQLVEPLGRQTWNAELPRLNAPQGSSFKKKKENRRTWNIFVSIKKLHHLRNIKTMPAFYILSLGNKNYFVPFLEKKNFILIEVITTITTTTTTTILIRMKIFKRVLIALLLCYYYV